MKIINKSLTIKKITKCSNIFDHIKHEYVASLSLEDCDQTISLPIRFIITKTTATHHECEIDILDLGKDDISKDHPIKVPPKKLTNFLKFKKRERENTDTFNAVLIIPTGVDAALGGHCGDGNAVARLVASACDTLITHPNVVNAADYNELPENGLYVEGSTISRLFLGQVGLQKVRSNRVLLITETHSDDYFNNEVINAASTSRVTLGASCEVLRTTETTDAIMYYSPSGRASGSVDHIEHILALVEKNKSKYDAFAIATFIKVPEDFHTVYFTQDSLVNPWGGLEAMITHSISEIYDVPCAHAPLMTSREVMTSPIGIVEPRKAPETASATYMYSVLKGMHKSPKIVSYDNGLNAENISCLIIPYGCIGVPTLACIEQDIPIIAVKGNTNLMDNTMETLPFRHDMLFIVDNYLEAIGVMQAIKAGVAIDTVSRPIKDTVVTFCSS